MLGNPSQSNWPDNGFYEYVIASLPQLELLDGKEVHRSDRIKALQVFPERQRYLREQAAIVRSQKAAAIAAEQQQESSSSDNVIEVSSHGVTDISLAPDGPVPDAKKASVLQSDDKVPYTPHTRREMYLELAEQKETEEARKRENQPKERNPDKEHIATLARIRSQEQADDDASVRQCNEGKWVFRLHDELETIVLEVDLPRFLDTSLIDVDVHPAYVSIVAKNKLLRLRFPERVHSDAGTAERSKVTGTLRLTLPKAHVSATQQLRAQLQREEQERASAGKPTSGVRAADAKQRTDKRSASTRSVRHATPVTKLSDEVRSHSLLCVGD